MGSGQYERFESKPGGDGRMDETAGEEEGRAVAVETSGVRRSARAVRRTSAEPAGQDRGYRGRSRFVPESSAPAAFRLRAGTQREPKWGRCDVERPVSTRGCGVPSETVGSEWGTGVRPPPLRFEWNGRTTRGRGPHDRTVSRREKRLSREHRNSNRNTARTEFCRRGLV